MQRTDNHQNRDQDFKRAGNTGRHLFRQANSDVVLLEPGINASGVNRRQHCCEDPLAGEVLSGNLSFMIGGRYQQERHKRQQAGHHRVKIKLTAQARTDTDRNEEGHDPHAQVERQH